MDRFVIYDSNGVIEEFEGTASGAHAHFEQMVPDTDGGWAKGDLVLAQILAVRH